MSEFDGTLENPEMPDYSPLLDAAKQLGEQMVLDFPARIGARPFVRYRDGEWEGISVGPWDRTDEGDVSVGVKPIEVDESRVREMLENSNIAELVFHTNSPFGDEEDWEWVDDSHDDGREGKDV